LGERRVSWEERKRMRLGMGWGKERKWEGLKKAIWWNTGATENNGKERKNVSVPH
jgi:hypothetical protein